MRSLELRAPPALPAAVLPWTAVAAALFAAAWLLQPRGAGWTLLALAGFALGEPLVRGALHGGPRRRVLSRMLLGGTLGMLAGLALDHPLGFVPSLAVCRTAGGGWLGDAAAAFTQMPCACLAMVAACECGEWLQGRAARCRRAGRLAAHAAMLAGMALAHAAATRYGAGLPASWLGAGLLLAMPAGMAAGLLLVSPMFAEVATARRSVERSADA